MRYRTAFLMCSLFVLWSEPRLFAKHWAIDAPKGAVVVIKAPIHLWKAEAVSLSTGAPIYIIDADSVIASSRWNTTGLPYFGQFIVTKIFGFRTFRGLKYTDVELRNDFAWVKLRFQPGADI